VEVVLTADGPDTVVELYHHDLPAEDFDGHLSGWTAKLDRLVQVCAGRTTYSRRPIESPPGPATSGPKM